MQIPKPTEADKEYFLSLVPDSPGVEVKPMFGNVGAFVHGNMFAGLFGSAVGVRLSEADLEELAATAGSGPFGPAERPMGGYLSLPADWLRRPEQAADWVGRALTFVGALPAKQPKQARPKPTGSR